MGWAVWMSIKQLEYFASWSIVWNWVWCWSQAIPGILALVIRDELAPKIVINLVVILLLVHAIGRGLPYIDRCTSQWFSCRSVCDCSIHVGDLSIIWSVECNG